ncbi:hypothetical protein QYE76_064293 [Lolium multiflorum]|uniref:Integrase catalytic domain-containing protein n=1 Tax=Lolium multiflorum TaxID=4521 RepID=A0AAD8W7U4_LOLMU|nr:hypothetical protein QYE76_064293 [Lolium multiflorum]
MCDVHGMAVPIWARDGRRLSSSAVTVAVLGRCREVRWWLGTPGPQMEEGEERRHGMAGMVQPLASMENYSLLMGDSSGDEDGGGVDGEAFRGHFPSRGVPEQRLLSPYLGFDGGGSGRWHALATARTWLEDLRDDARCQGPLSGLGSLPALRVAFPVGGFWRDLPAEHKKKYDELKAICEAELIGSFETTRSHSIKLKGDTRLSHGVNTVDLSHSIREPGFSFSVNMARLVNCHSADKAESSHSRGKDKEEAVPRDRPQDDDRRYLIEEEVRSTRYQRPLSAHLLNKCEQQYDRRRRYDEDDERYRRSDAVRRYRQYDRNNDGYERNARGRSREQDDVDKHWDCPFFKHCWDSGMSRLPTIENCPECKQQRRRTNEVSVFERLGPLPPHNKRAESSQEEDFEESDGEEDRYHRPRWCPDGLSHSQKRRVQRLRNLEEAEAQYLYTLRRARPDLAAKIQQTSETKARPPKKVWRPKQAKADAQASADADVETSAGTNTVFRISSEIYDPRHGERASSESRHHNKRPRSCKPSLSITMEKEADFSNRPALSSTYALPVFNIDLASDGKLGYGFTSADELEEIDIGPGDKPRPTFISKKLDPHLRGLMIALLKEYPDCFAWDYTEMPGLDRSIIEHRLPLKKGFRPFQQRARQMKAEVLEEVKKEIKKMLDAGFIRPCRYAEWISNVVPVEKKDGRWRVAIDFRNLNSATPKDEYPMPVAETLINAAAGHKILSFMDGNAGYNQIFMAPEDIHKTAFRVPGSVGLFEYVVMTFGLKNAGATYQRAMNYIFHDLIGKLVEIYIDDVVVKSVATDGHLEDLRQVLDRTRKFGLRMNPKKCAFGVTAGQFLGFLVHERGIEIGLKSQEAVRTMKPPTTKKELQCLIGKINFVRRFISNLSGRIEPFMGLVKIKPDEEFRWGAEQQQAFDDIKEYLTKPPVLVPPRQDRPFYIYLSVADTSIASWWCRYPEIEKLCLCLFFTCTKIQHILVSADIIVICKSDVIKHMLSAPVLKGRLGKWMFALSEFEIRYQPAKAVKGQALADLIAERINTDVAALSVRAWAMFFDGSVCEDGCGIGVLLVSPRGATYSFSIKLADPCTNNVAEYEAICKGMKLLLEAGAEAVEIFGDSKLVISQLTEEYKCESESLFPFWVQCRELMVQFRTLEGLLLKCLGPAESNRLLHEVHEGACGTHQSAHKMKWLIRRSGFYWPTMLEDCFQYYKGCQACQKFGSIQMVPASAMNPIIKPWPFRGWGMDMIGEIHPSSSKGHRWVLAITDYFTKWVEAVPMKKVASEDVIKFVLEHVIHRFGIPQTITTDGGSVFVSKEMKEFCDDMGIKLIRSSPYYAQANGQAEASNKSLIKLIKRKIDEHPKRWHEVLSEALWAYRMSCHGAIKTTPYQLVYGQEAVLPWEVKAGSRRVTFQNDLTAEEYAALISDSIEDATELRLWSLEKIKENKAKVARAYNKKVKPKEFQVDDLVWEAVLPLGTRDKEYGKWSPNWHGPYKVVQVLKGNAYMLEMLDGVKFPVAVNGQHLKKYFPSMWDDGQDMEG